MNLGLRGGVRLLAASLLFGGAVSMAAPASTLAQDPTLEDASLRIVHGSPDAPPVDVIIDGAVVVENLAFGEATEYVQVSTDGTRQVQVVPTGQPAESAVIDTEIDLEEGNSYLFAATGLLNEIDSNLYDVDLSGDDMDSNQARVRLIHLSPDAGSVDVYVAGGDELIDDANFPDASGYTTVDAGTYDLEVRAHDSDAVALSVPGVEIQAGRVYDIVALGQVSTDSLTALALETVVSPACSEILGVGTDADACVRVLHASPDAPAVDVYVNDTLLVENLAFGENTIHAAVPGGEDRNIKVVPTGSPLDSSVLDEGVNLDAGTAYTLIVRNNLDDISLGVAEDDISPLPANQSRIAVIHAAPNTPDVDVVITDGGSLFEGVSFEDETDDIVLDSGTYDIQLKDGDTVLARVEQLVLEPGWSYYVVAIGSAENNTLEVIALGVPASTIEGSEASPSSSPNAGGESLVETESEEMGTPVS
jgi:hypothetical protein